MKRKLATTLLLFLVGIVAIAAVSANRVEAAAFLTYKAHLPSLALELYPNAVLAFEIGDYYFNANGSGVYDLNAAEHYYRKSLELDPATPAAWHQLARIDFLRGNFNAALAEINTQIVLHGHTVIPSYYVRGLIYGFMKNYDFAEKDFRVFLKAKPRNWGVYNDLAWVYFAEGKYAESASIAQQGLSVSPESPWLLTSEGVALLNLGEKDKAADALRKALMQAELLTPADWSMVNPGNDPHIAAEALDRMKEIIRKNLDLALIPSST